MAKVQVLPVSQSYAQVVLGTFQPREQEWGPPAGTVLENTLAESHFSGECGSATWNSLLWQQAALAESQSLRRAYYLPTATRKAAAVLLSPSVPRPPVRLGSVQGFEECAP